jgi:hypothetical protein
MTSEELRLLVHSITTTSESEVHEYLAKISDAAKKAFVLTSRMPDDEAHIRYDVFTFVKDEGSRFAHHHYHHYHRNQSVDPF